MINWRRLQYRSKMSKDLFNRIGWWRKRSTNCRWLSMPIVILITKAKPVCILQIDSLTPSQFRTKSIIKMDQGSNCHKVEAAMMSNPLGIDHLAIRLSIVRNTRQPKLKQIVLWQEWVKFWFKMENQVLNHLMVRQSVRRRNKKYWTNWNSFNVYKNLMNKS